MKKLVFTLATYIYGYIYRSQDNGNTWTRLENGLPLNQGLVYNHPVALITSGSEDIFYSTYATDGTALPKTSAGDPSIDTDTGFFSSTDHGEIWTKINKSLPCKNPSPCDSGWGPLAVDAMGTPFLAIYDYNSGKAANFYHVFYSLDRGESWIEVGAGVRFFAQGGLTSLGVSPSGYVYVGFTAGLYRSKQPITVSRDESPIEIPQRLLLEQNYPNPFNERSTIAFYVPETGPVRLTLYSLLGKKITTLINGPLAMGKHRVSVDGTGLAGGVYLYRLEASSVVESKVMMIRK